MRIDIINNAWYTITVKAGRYGRTQFFDLMRGESYNTDGEGNYDYIEVLGPGGTKWFYDWNDENNNAKFTWVGPIWEQQVERREH